MSIRYLKTYIAIHELGSFAAAARFLNLTQSAISMQMKALEEDLSIKLFDRTKRPPQFTEAGANLIPKARKAINAFEQLSTLDDNKLDAQGLNGKLVIGAVPSVLTGIMPKALVALRDKHPGIHVELTMDLSACLVEQVATRKVNAAIVSDLMAQQDGLQWEPFAHEPLVLIVPIDAPNLSAEQFLSSYPFIRYTRQAWFGQLIDRLLKNHGFTVNETMTMHTLEAVSTMVYHGLGISIVPIRVVEQPRPLPVRQLSLPDPVVTRVLGLLSHRDNDKAPATKALYRELKFIADLGAHGNEPASHEI